jgi:hypothetical protein
MKYKIVEIDGKKCVYLYSCDPPQYLCAADLWQWLKELREEDSPLYPQLVHAYILLTKSGWRP